MTKHTKFAIFADGNVGLKVIEHLLSNRRDYLKAIVVVDRKSDVFKFLVRRGFSKEKIFFNKDIYKQKTLKSLESLNLDYIILAWWPFIIKKAVFSIPRLGTLNFHPSFLPYNRGKHYNFWTIVENSPFGVTIHFVNEHVDGGDILFQKSIPKTWEDTGESLYNKAQKAIINLFIKSFPYLEKGHLKRIKQRSKKGSFHHSKELEPASAIKLDRTYKARDLLNLLRARTFHGYPGCYFFENGKKYEVGIVIKESK